jgi:glycolate oxidase
MNPGKISYHWRYSFMFGMANPFLGFLGGRSTQESVPPEEVHARLTDYMEHIYTCVSCAYCRDGCPIYTERGWESAAPKGKMVFAKEYMESRIDVDDYMYKRIFECTLCGQCQEVCQAEIPLCDIWADVRAKFWELGYEPMEAHVMMQDSLEAEGNPFKEPSSARDELFPEDAVGLIREGDTREPDILVWAGCVNSYQDIKTLPAFMKVLDAAGVTYKALGTEEGCCGYVAHITGMPAFDDLAHGAAQRINECGAPVVVTPCAGCDKSFAKIYPEHGIEVKPEALHGVQLLDRLISEGRLRPEKPFKKRVTWHDPCDIGRHLGIYDEPRRVLKAIPELDFVEMPHNREKAVCCGGGGGLKASDLDLSSDIALRRVKEAISVGAEVIVSSCPSCKANLKIAADRARKEKIGKVQVMDINELLVRTLPKKRRE